MKSEIGVLDESIWDMGAELERGDVDTVSTRMGFGREKSGLGLGEVVWAGDVGETGDGVGWGDG